MSSNGELNQVESEKGHFSCRFLSFCHHFVKLDTLTEHPESGCRICRCRKATDGSGPHRCDPGATAGAGASEKTSGRPNPQELEKSKCRNMTTTNNKQQLKHDIELPLKLETASWRNSVPSLFRCVRLVANPDEWDKIRPWTWRLYGLGLRLYGLGSAMARWMARIRMNQDESG